MLRFGLALILLPALMGAQNGRVGSVDFFGTLGVDVAKISSALPIHAGDQISEGQAAGIRHSIDLAIESATGHPATDIAFVCCDDHAQLAVFIGLGGKNSKVVSLAPPPDGSACLAAKALALYNSAMSALNRAVQTGKTGEDDSHGYALSEDAATRAKQLAMHAYAITREQELEQALRACRTPHVRQAAATLLGYSENTTAQTDALVRASRDSDDGVRNNAVRALLVLAKAHPNTASRIPSAAFIEMLNSGVWTDRNKAGELLKALTESRDAGLLNRLRTSALPSLIEMAQWHDSSHAYAYRVLLGRIAGFDEARIQELIASGRWDEILAAVKTRPSALANPR